jgi:DNA-binding transcriptional ArsR family regulator
MSAASVSNHVRVLRKVGLVKRRLAGRQTWYSINARPLKQVLRWVRACQATQVRS